MKFHATHLPDAWIVEMEPFTDARGAFARTFCSDEFQARGLDHSMVQTNLSVNPFAHTLRGLHYQVQGAEEAKLIQCVQGAILDVIVDVRPGSPTFGQHLKVRLAGEDYRLVYVPRGFAHGFITLDDDTRVLYQVSTAYAAGKERGIRWDDPGLGIEWPTRAPILSDKDASWPDFLPECVGAAP